VSEKKPFLMRVDRELLEQLQRWASDDLRSVNGQIEFLLRDALKRAGRAAKSADVPASELPVQPEAPDASES
jgi:hypothetical protein